MAAAAAVRVAGRTDILERIVNAEEVRILRAAADGRLRMNAAGRYVIDGEARPERKAREKLLHRLEFISWPLGGIVDITSEGRAALALIDAEARP